LQLRKGSGSEISFFEELGGYNVTEKGWIVMGLPKEKMDKL